MDEEEFCVLSFVSANVVDLKKVVWLSKFHSEQISNVEECLDKRAANLA